MARTKRQPSEEPSIPATARPSYDAVVALTDAFCREHLDGEYEAMCRKLAGALARKRPSPLPSGKPETWACGIVRTIGWVNYLDAYIDNTISVESHASLGYREVERLVHFVKDPG